MSRMTHASGASSRKEERRVSNGFWVAPAVLLVLGWAAFFGFFDGGSPLRIDIFDGIGRNETRFRSETPLESLDVRFSGTVEANDDETGFRSLSPGARVEIVHRDGLRTRRLAVEPVEDGTLHHEFADGGRNAAFDDGARAWLANLLPRVLSETGLGAKHACPDCSRGTGPMGCCPRSRESSTAPPWSRIARSCSRKRAPRARRSSASSTTAIAASGRAETRRIS